MISKMMDLNRPSAAEQAPAEVLVTERDSRLVIDLSGITHEGARGAVEDLDIHTNDATLETAVTLVGMANKLPPGGVPGIGGAAVGSNALDLSTQQRPAGSLTSAATRTVKEEHLPRKKRRIDDVLADSPDKQDKENGPPTSKIARRDDGTVATIKTEKDEKTGEPKQENKLVDSFVAKAMKIWYDEDLAEASRNREEPKDLTCKETMPKTDSFVSSYPPGYPRPDDAHSSESSSYPFLKLKAMLRKKYANSLNEFSGDESMTSQPSPPLREGSPASPLELDVNTTIIEAKNGEKLFRCNICFKAFTFSTNLTRHQRNIHGKPYRRRTKEFVMDKRIERRDSTGSDLSRPGTPDSRPMSVDAMSDHSNHEICSNRSTPLSHLARPVCNQCDMEFDNDEQLELHNCDQTLDQSLDRSIDRSMDRSIDRSVDRSMDRSLDRSAHFTEPISFIQELTSKIERASHHPLKSRCEDLMREENRRASFGGVPQYDLPSGVDRRLSMETGLVPPKQIPFENEKKFQIVLSENRSHNASPVPRPVEREQIIPSPVPVNLGGGLASKDNEADMWRFKCIECRLAFPSSKHLSKHLKVVHKVSIKDDPNKEGHQPNDHQCQECGKTFSQQAYLRRHMRNIHMRPQHLEVPKLPPQAPVPNSMNIVRNAGSLLIPGMTTIFCHLCGQTFSHPVHHYMHMAMSHGIMLQPDKDQRLLMHTEKGQGPHPAEPREADTAETRPVMGNLPSQLLPSGLIPIVPSYHLMKEKQLQQQQHQQHQQQQHQQQQHSPVVKEEKRPALLEGRRYQDNGLDLTKDRERVRMAINDHNKENPMNLGEFILKKVVQEVKSPMYESSPKDLSRKYRAEDYGKENQENNNVFSRNLQNININQKNSPQSLTAERMMFPTHSDGKRHICGLCGASFTFQTNLTRHQRKLHGKPFVRRPSASQVFKQESTT